MQHIANLDREKLGIYNELLITDEVILTDERLFEHILLLHREEYSELRPYIKEIIEYPDYILEDSKHVATLIFIKRIENIDKFGRVVIRIAVKGEQEHLKNSIITLMKLNKRTWKQTLKNKGKIIWKKSGQ